jgi:hypothetical protein
MCTQINHISRHTIAIICLQLVNGHYRGHSSLFVLPSSVQFWIEIWNSECKCNAMLLCHSGVVTHQVTVTIQRRRQGQSGTTTATWMCVKRTRPQVASSPPPPTKRRPPRVPRFLPALLGTNLCRPAASFTNQLAHKQTTLLSGSSYPLHLFTVVATDRWQSNESVPSKILLGIVQQ